MATTSSAGSTSAATDGMIVTLRELGLWILLVSGASGFAVLM